MKTPEDIYQEAQGILDLEHENYKNTVRWLRSYRDLSNRLAVISDKMEGPRSPRIGDGLEGTGTPLDMNEMIDMKTDIEQRMSAISASVLGISNERAKSVIIYRFLMNMKLEYISDRMGYSLATTKRLYKQGIEDLVRRDCAKS